MQLDRKTLAFVQLPSSKGDLYSPAAGNRGFIHTAEIHNTNTTDEVVVLNYHDGTNEYQLYKITVPADDTVILDFRGVGNVIDDGGKLTGNTTTAAKVSLKLSGTEETPGVAASGGGAAAGGAESNQWATPTTPHAADDEFDGADMSAWSIQNINDGVAGSFSYDTVDSYDSTFTSGNVVRCSLAEKPSWALLQVPAYLKNFIIYKGLTYPTNLLMTARLKTFHSRDQNSDRGIIGIVMGGLTGGVPASAKRVQFGLMVSSGNQNRAVTNYWNSAGSVSNVIADGIVDDGWPYHHSYLALHKVGTEYHYWMGSADNNWVHYLKLGSIDFTPDYVAVYAVNRDVADPGVNVVGVDYMRFYETANFFL